MLRTVTIVLATVLVGSALAPTGAMARGGGHAGGHMGGHIGGHMGGHIGGQHMGGHMGGLGGAHLGGHLGRGFAGLGDYGWYGDDWPLATDCYRLKRYHTKTGWHHRRANVCG